MPPNDRLQLSLRILNNDADRHFRVERYAPGDGWTRYTIVMDDKTPEGFPTRVELRNSMTYAELMSFIDGMWRMCKLTKEAYRNTKVV